jgi:integrase
MSNSDRIRIGDRVSIYRRGKNGIWWVSFWQDNQHRKWSLRTRNKKVATDKAIVVAAKLGDGTFKPQKPSMNVRDAQTEYITFLTSEGRARKTTVRYNGELTAFCDFLESHRVVLLSGVSVPLMDKYRAHRRKDHMERTVYHESIVIKQWLKWCKKRGYVAENVLADYDLEKPRRKKTLKPTLKQVNAILAAAEEPRRSQYASMAFTSMRVGEIQRLIQQDVDFRGNWIHVLSRDGAKTKTGEERKIPIHQRLRSLLEAQPKSGQRWFFTAAASQKFPDGSNWLNVRQINVDFQKLCRKLGYPAGRKEHGLTVHSLRGFFRSFCINNGIPQRVVDEWMGFSRAHEVSDAYYVLTDEESQAWMKKVPFGDADNANDDGEGGLNNNESEEN